MTSIFTARQDDTISIIEREWKVERKVAEESYHSIVRALSQDGTASEAGLSVHFQLIQKAEQGIGEVPLGKVVDFGPLAEARRELGGR